MLLLSAHRSPPLAFLKFSPLLWTLRHLQLLGRGGMRRILTNNIFLQVLCNPSGPGPGWTWGAGGQSILTPLLSSSSYNLKLLELSVGYLPSCSGDPAGLQSLIKWYYRKLLPSLIRYSGNVNVADKSINDNIHVDCNFLFPRLFNWDMFILFHIIISSMSKITIYKNKKLHAKY